MTYVAQKYLDDKIEWNELQNSLSSNWPHSHIAEMCQKLEQMNNESTAEAIDYDYFKAVCSLNEEELYEIGATALDCSIMLTSQRVKNDTDLKSG